MPGGDDKGVSGSGAGKIIQTNNKILTKKDIENLIEVKSERVSLQEYDKAKSQVWMDYKIIAVDLKVTNFVKCQHCTTVIAWSGHGGTSTLSRHQVTCKGNTKVAAVPIKSFLLKPVSETRIDKLNETILIGLAKDLRPLKMVDGSGFLKIAQSLVDFGAEHGPQDVKNILRHRTTLKSKYLPAAVQKTKNNVLSALKAAPSFPKLAFTSDMWSDNHRKRNFLSLTVHFIDSNFSLKSFLLEAREFPDERKTAENIRAQCLQILEKYFPAPDEAQLVFESSTAVTDGGSNMISVFPNRLWCQCHKLNLLLEHLFSENNLDTKFTTIKSALHGVKQLVTYYKQSGLNSSLEVTLKQDVATRWNSKLIMLESYINSIDHVKTILLEKKQIHRLGNIDELLIKDLVDFLLPFRNCSEQLSAEKEPTINLIAVWYQDLWRHINVQESDSLLIRNLKEESQVWFKKYCELEELHYVACMLNPKYKKLQFVDGDVRKRAVSRLRLFMEAYHQHEPTYSQTPANEGISPKKSRLSVYEDKDEQSCDELESYLSFTLPKSDNFDLTSFWNESTMFPTLKKVAGWILAIPASSASSERTFSTTGFTLNCRRTQLNGSTLADLTFLHKNASI